MDRNLGALNKDEDKVTQWNSGVFFPFGSSNPFIAGGKPYYDITGKQKWSNTQKVNSSIKTVCDYVRQPYIQICNGGGGDWWKDNPYKMSLWNNPSWNDISSKNSKHFEKSLFDPCPVGWKIPRHDIWSSLLTNNTKTNYGYSLYCDGIHSDLYAFYPFGGVNYGDGSQQYGWQRCMAVYASDTNNGAGGWHLNVDSRGSISISNNNSHSWDGNGGRTSADAVRCIQE